MRTNLAEVHSLRPAPSEKKELQAYLHTLHQFDNLDHFPGVALESLLALCGAAAGSFFVWDEAGKELILKSAQGPYRDRISRSQIRLREGILGWVGDHDSSILVKDIDEDERFQSFKRSGQYRSSSFISIPLHWKHSLLGVVNITERENLAPFEERDYRVACEFASHIASAYGRLKERACLERENQELKHTVSNLQREIRAREPLVTAGKLAMNITHELGNPLDAIRRYINLSLAPSLDTVLIREYLLKAKGGIRRAIRVIRHLRHYAAAHKPAYKPVEIHELIENSLEGLSRDARFQNVKIRKKLCSVPCRVADHGLLLVLQNLYENACHAMKGEGVITVETIREPGKVMIRVEDTGAGVAEEIQEKLFEPFFSTKNHAEGIGMGLSICKEVVERSGGSLHCENLSRGARFVIVLPCQNKGDQDS